MRNIPSKIFTFLFCLATAEALYRVELFEQLQDKRFWWTNITPFKLYPSELALLLAIPALCYYALARKARQTLSGDVLILVISIIALGICHALYGWFENSSSAIWLTDYRQTFLFFLLFPLTVWSIGPSSSRPALATFCDFCIPIALLNGIVGILQFAGSGVDIPLLPARTHYSCGQLLLLPALTTISNAGEASRPQNLRLICYLFGIITPLEKPVIAATVLSLSLLAIVIFAFSKAKGGRVTSISAMFAAVCLVCTIVFIAFGGESLRYLEQRFFKTHVSDVKRDVSTGRFEMWLWGLKRFSEHPILGTGLGDRPIDPRTRLPSTAPLHNLSVEILSQTGLVGFIVWAVFYIRMARLNIERSQRIVNSRDRAFAFSTITWLATMIASAHYGRTLGVSNVAMVFWIVMGMQYFNCTYSFPRAKPILG